MFPRVAKAFVTNGGVACWQPGDGARRSRSVVKQAHSSPDEEKRVSLQADVERLQGEGDDLRKQLSAEKEASTLDVLPALAGFSSTLP